MNKKGFTLAEVLITLSIIGVVAALTIPSLIVKNQEKQTVVQLKKVYNTFSNAFSLAEIEYGNGASFGWGNADGYDRKESIDVLNKLAPFLNIIRRCDQEKGCFSDIVKKPDGSNPININENRTYAKGILADGTNFSIWSVQCNNNFGEGKLKEVCGGLTVDLNGFKGPNTSGKDVFDFWLTTTGVVPYGTPSDTEALVSTCFTKGDSCTAWVLLKENMNYSTIGTGWN